MLVSTLCYLEQDGCWLMLHRIKKKKDVNHDKWIGVGGKCENGETPDACLLREVQEETGLTLTGWRYRGLVHFMSDSAPDEEMHLYTADRWTGEMIRGDACAEGVLEWVPMERVEALPLWEGDKVFLRLLREDAPLFELTLRYRGEALAEVTLDGAPDLGGVNRKPVWTLDPVQWRCRPAARADLPAMQALYAAAWRRAQQQAARREPHLGPTPDREERSAPDLRDEWAARLEDTLLLWQGERLLGFAVCCPTDGPEEPGLQVELPTAGPEQSLAVTRRLLREALRRARRLGRTRMGCWVDGGDRALQELCSELGAQAGAIQGLCYTYSQEMVWTL